MEQGQSFKDIDEMDILYYFELIGHKIKEKRKKELEYIETIL